MNLKHYLETHYPHGTTEYALSQEGFKDLWRGWKRVKARKIEVDPKLKAFDKAIDTLKATHTRIQREFRVANDDRLITVSKKEYLPLFRLAGRNSDTGVDALKHDLKNCNAMLITYGRETRDYLQQLLTEVAGVRSKRTNTFDLYNALYDRKTPQEHLDAKLFDVGSFAGDASLVDYDVLLGKQARQLGANLRDQRRHLLVTAPPVLTFEKVSVKGSEVVKVKVGECLKAIDDYIALVETTRSVIKELFKLEAKIQHLHDNIPEGGGNRYYHILDAAETQLAVCVMSQEACLRHVMQVATGLSKFCDTYLK